MSWSYHGLVTALAMALWIPVSFQEVPRQSLMKVGESGLGDSGPFYSALLDVAAGPGGDVYVLDLHPPFLRWFSKGKLQKEWGREGAGPGEFGGPGSLGWRGDTLWVTDLQHRRLTLLRRNGTFIRTVSVSEGRARGLPHALTPQGFIVNAQVTGERGVEADSRQPYSLHLSAIAPDGATSAMATLVLQNRPLRVAARINGVQGGLQIGQPFNGDPLFRVTRDGSSVVIVERRPVPGSRASSFSVTRIGSNGDTAFTRRFSYPSMPVDPATLQAAVNEIRMMPRSRTSRIEIQEQDIRRAIFVPSEQPPVEEMAVTRDGTIWLRRPGAANATVAEHLLLDDAGKTRAIVMVPKGEDVLESNGSTVWTRAVEEGAFILRWYRIGPFVK